MVYGLFKSIERFSKKVPKANWRSGIFWQFLYGLTKDHTPYIPYTNHGAD
jgi:hypothetical protein